ncbi:hypothetical protein DV735_g3513, partial [Chaetothyriales sp. CBS 134920]
MGNCMSSSAGDKKEKAKATNARPSAHNSPRCPGPVHIATPASRNSQHPGASSGSARSARSSRSSPRPAQSPAGTQSPQSPASAQSAAGAQPRATAQTAQVQSTNGLRPLGLVAKVEAEKAEAKRQLSAKERKAAKVACPTAAALKKRQQQQQ